MIRIALVADLHLSDVTATPQEESFDWSVGALDRLAPDAAVWLGDVTACGSPEAALRFRERIDALPFPSLTVPGNSDVRTPATAPSLERFLSSHGSGLSVGGLTVIGANTAYGTLSESEQMRLAHLSVTGDVLFCTHHSPEDLDGESLDFLRLFFRALKYRGHRVLAWVHGHLHVYRRQEFEGVPAVTVRTLDLDKCEGGDAHVCLLTVDGEDLTFREIPYDRSTLPAWSAKERRELSDALGITCFDRTKVARDMPFAIENGVRHLEWRSIKTEELPLVEAWRRAGGQTFSLHFPSLGIDGGAITGLPQYAAYANDALCAGVDLVTVHPPHVPRGVLFSGGTFDAFADAAAERLRPLTEAGVDVLVENSHTVAGAPRDPLSILYGCSPTDLLGWRNALRERLGAAHCHLRLDVGHARNNPPLAQPYPIGKWYALVGPAARSYHLHQIRFDKETHRLRSHYPITGIHDGFVAFNGFLWAWRSGLLCHGPIILEVREGEGACATWERLRGIVSESGDA